jgi:hypothetical protein
VWRIDRSAGGQETRFGYYAYTLTTIATCSTEDGQQPPPPPASAAELEPEPAAAAAAAAITMQSGGMAGVSVVDVLAMDPTKRQELIQQLPALLAVCEIVDGFDPGAVREGQRTTSLLFPCSSFCVVVLSLSWQNHHFFPIWKLIKLN